MISRSDIIMPRNWREGLGPDVNARKRFADVEFGAADADFRVGRGAPVQGPICDIVLVLSGRAAGPPGLSGGGIAAVTARV